MTDCGPFGPGGYPGGVQHLGEPIYGTEEYPGLAAVFRVGEHNGVEYVMTAPGPGGHHEVMGDMPPPYLVRLP